MRINLLALPMAALALCGCQGETDTAPKYNQTIENGSFESGLEGWTINGLSEDDVSDADTYSDQKHIDKEGDYSYVGGVGSLPSFKGTLTSDPFILGGIGQIALDIGAMKDQSKCYVEFYSVDSEQPLEFYANNNKTKLTKLTNSVWNGTTISSELVPNVVDLSDHLDEAIYIKFVDEDAGSDYTDYSFFNIDDIKVLQTAAERNDVLVERADFLLAHADEDIDAETPVTKLRNGGFETGDASYWKPIAGQAFDKDGLISSSTEMYWGNRQYHAEGNYFLNGLNHAESLTGVMRSEKFQVIDAGEGESYAKFMMGGYNAEVYVGINDAATGDELARFYNTGFKDPELAQSFITYYVDMSEYIGRTLYFTIVDYGTSGYGFAQVDGFDINLTEQEGKDGVAALREFAATTDDVEAASSYQALYNDGMSFPFAGNAPTIENTTFKVVPSEIDLLSYLDEVEIRDDYTAKSQLKIELDSVYHDGALCEDYDPEAFEVESGTYEVKFEVSDEYKQVTNGSYFIQVIDDFNENIDAETPVTKLRNGGFETGDASYWKPLYGYALLKDGLISSSSEMYWGNRQYHAEGNYFLNGLNKDEALTGAMRSEKFQVIDAGDGKSYAKFMMGGYNEGVYVAINNAETGEELMSFRNTGFKDPELAQSFITYYVDLSDYIGQTLYFTIVDEATSSFGFAQVDGFDINLTEQEGKDGVAALREFAATTDDADAAASYQNLYNGGMSFPFAGNAPTAGSDKSFFTIPSSVNLLSYASQSGSYDDYTSSSDLEYSIVSATFEGQAVNVADPSDFNVEAGTYEVQFTVADAFGQSSNGTYVLSVGDYNEPDIQNGGFESGNLEGWTQQDGATISDNPISNETNFWAEDIPFNKSGEYFFNGWNTEVDEADGYSIRSTMFKLSGSGYITFKLGGRSASLALIDASTGEEVAVYQNSEFNDGNFPLVKDGCRLSMTKYVADCSSLIGRYLYVELRDNVLASGLSWGVAFFDDIVVNNPNPIAVEGNYDTVVQNGEEVQIPYAEAINTL